MKQLTKHKQPELIYCADGNRRFAEIAIEHGFTYGAQLPNTIYFTPEFVDQDYKKPNLNRYLEALKQHRPRLATVLDWEKPNQLPAVLVWAEAIAEFVEIVIVIPKVLGGIEKLPSIIGNNPIRLGFSYPTTFGKASFDILLEMIGWPYGVHILGGAPHKQFELASGRFRAPRQRRHAQRCMFTTLLDVRSVDCNMHLKMATKFNAFFDPAKSTKRYYWPTLEDYDSKRWGDGSESADAPYEAFRRSCQNIAAMWRLV